LTEDERKELMSQGRCFRCREHGHLSRSCPKANVVQSRSNNKPPGMGVFAAEMGYDDDDVYLSDGEEFFDADESDDNMDIHALGVDSWPDDEDEQDFPREHFNLRDSDESKDDYHMPPWMEEEKPHTMVRNHLGDALRMRAEYVLNMSQPYPGDRAHALPAHGMRDRFGVHRINDANYAIVDRLYNDKPVLVPTYRLEHPNFRVGRWYARFRNARVFKRPFLRGTYNLTMGDAYSEVAWWLLSDG
ncbi:hypothetical protein DFP72DRAFT_751030, partial [Ephemerocybe angulata]